MAADPSMVVCCCSPITLISPPVKSKENCRAFVSSNMVTALSAGDLTCLKSWYHEHYDLYLGTYLLKSYKMKNETSYLK